MRHHRLSLIAAAALAGTLAACHPKSIKSALEPGSDGRPMATVSKLTCPERVRDLTRASRAADGLSCVYGGPRGESVTLTLTPLNGATAGQRLAAIETGLQAELPGVAGPSHGSGVYVAHDAGSDQAHIDLPGFHLTATGDGARIRMPGVSIDANGDDARVQTGLGPPATVNAHAGGAEIRTGGAGPQGVSARYLLVSHTAGPSGVRAVGYLAKGPAAGPLVIALFRLPEPHSGERMGSDGVDALVDQNVHP